MKSSYIDLAIYLLLRTTTSLLIDQASWLLLAVYVFGFVGWERWYEHLDRRKMQLYARMLPRWNWKHYLVSWGTFWQLGLVGFLLSRYGWINTKNPTIAEEILILLLWYGWLEIYFSIAHYYAHHPRIYKWLHKMHHRYVYTRPWCCQYAHPLEVWLISIPDALGICFLMSIPAVIAVPWSMIMVRHNVMVHRFDPTKTKHHAIHHQDGRYNTGNSTRFSQMIGNLYPAIDMAPE